MKSGMWKVGAACPGYRYFSYFCRMIPNPGIPPFLFDNMKKAFLWVLWTLCTAICGRASGENISGSWQGTLKVTPQIQLKLVLNIGTDAEGKPTVTLDSPDQGAYGIVGEVKFVSEDSVYVAVPNIGLSFAGKKEADRIVGQCSQGMMHTELILFPGKAEAKRPQTPRPPFPYKTREVVFHNTSDRAALSGTLTLPEGANENTPVVVMVTGSGLQNRDEELFGHKPFAVIADYLARKGIASLRYDDRGCGKSTGNVEHATTRTFAEDAEAGVRYVRENGPFRKVGVLGHSEGCTVAFMLGERNIPDFIVAMGAPSVRGDSILIDQSAFALRENGVGEKVIEDYVKALSRIYFLKRTKGNEEALAGVDGICGHWDNTPVYGQLKENLKSIVRDANPWLDYFAAFSPAQSIANTRCPAFVLYGGKDIQVRPELNMPMMKRLAPHATVRLYPGLNHPFQHANTGSIAEYSQIEETLSPEVLQDIAGFILSQQ